jgi:1-acyl-sn-glycerol-3-phosphate acyltransferase
MSLAYPREAGITHAPGWVPSGMAVDLLYSSLRTVLRPTLARAFQWVLDGEEHVPSSGGVVLAANHISYLDALCLAYLADRRGRRVRFLAKASFFEIPVLGALLRGVGDIPAGRRRSDPPGGRGSALDAAVAELAAGHCIGIFPEGRISPDLEPQRPHTGVARLAAGAGVPVVPVGLWGGHRVWTRGHRPHLRPGLTQAVLAGPPVVVEPDEDPHAATERIMAAVGARVEDARRVSPQ